jgi:Ca-activated chloride channel family protein
MVWIGEYLNAFAFSGLPTQGAEAFSIQMEAGVCPWNPRHWLLEIVWLERENPAEGRAGEALDLQGEIKFNPHHIQTFRPLTLVYLRSSRSSTDGPREPAYRMALYELVPQLPSEQSPEAAKDTQYPASFAPSQDTPPWARLTILDRQAPRQVQRHSFLLRPQDIVVSQNSENFRWATAVAGFGLLLQQSPYRGDLTFDQVLEWAESARGKDLSGKRSEFIHLVKMARELVKDR